MKKIYNKRQLADLIIANNDGTFIPNDVLIRELTYLYRIKKIIRKKIKGDKYSEQLLINLVKIVQNIFTTKGVLLLANMAMEDNEIDILKGYIFKQ